VIICTKYTYSITAFYIFTHPSMEYKQCSILILGSAFLYVTKCYSAARL